MSNQFCPQGDGQEPSPDDLLSVQEVADLVGVSRSAIRQWRLKPASEIAFGRGRVIRLYRRSDVLAYAASKRRLNRLPK